MATIVTSIPKAVRNTKYNYAELFDGQARRLVQGEDFTVPPLSFRGALYTRKGTINKGKAAEEQMGLSVYLATEDGKSVAYVQATLPKSAEAPVESEPVAEVTPEPEPEPEPEVKAEKVAPKKAPAKKATAARRAPVTPNPKVARETVAK